MKLSSLHKPLLYIDLDHSLIHCANGESKGNSNYISCSFGEVALRPGVHYFLSSLLNLNYRLKLLTASTFDYANEIVDKFDLRKYFDNILAKEHIIDGHSGLLEFEPGKIIDNKMMPEKLYLIGGPRIPIDSWHGERQDRCLTKLTRQLKNNILI